ncbi:MAG: CocE/NonD family hydrolase [Solirubrobacterales bacterium]
MKRMGLAQIAVAAALLAALILAPVARAEFSTLYGGDVSCAMQPANGNVRLCSGKTTTWDGVTKIDVNVILPPAPSGGADGPYPLIGDFHGWGGSKIGLNEQTQSWAERGYAVFSMSDRGWGESCGATDPERLSPACAAGFNHLMDDRYEVRDAQYLISLLADEGVAEPQKIGATGYSYGGGMSMALATLRNRTMLPDGSLVPWESPGGKAMEIAAAVPQWPWSDLAYALMPNGTTLDYVAESPYLGPNGNAPIGVEKASYVSGLYGLGLAESNYAPPKTDPEADLTDWYSLINAGEPYDANPLAAEVVNQITTYHSSYYIEHNQPPAPLLIQSGWNDDLFPPDEAIRFYNRTRTQFPGDPISLFFMDDGHARSQNKPADEALFRTREEAWFDHYLKGEGAAPSSTATALTTVCGGPSEGPYTAASWKELAPGEIRLDSAATQTILPAAGDPAIGKEFDPIATGNACATASGADQAGAANYRLPVPSGGFTLLGAPTIIANLATTGSESELAARLLDVSPEGTERLVARGLLRPGSGGRMVFQLHPQAYRFAGGDTVKLELLPSDAPYSRPSNLQAPIAVSNLELRLPVREEPGALGGVVQPPAPKVLPPGYALAAGYESPGAVPLKANRGLTTVRSIAATRRALLVRLRCGTGGECSGRLAIVPRGKSRRRTALARGRYSLAPGQQQTLRLPLGKGGRRLVAASRHRTRRLSVTVQLEDAARLDPLRLRRSVRLPR